MSKRQEQISDTLAWIRNQRASLVVYLRDPKQDGLSCRPENLRWHQLLLKGIALEADILRSLEKMSPEPDLPACSPAELWAALNSVAEIKALLLKKPNLKKIVEALSR